MPALGGPRGRRARAALAGLAAALLVASCGGEEAAGPEEEPAATLARAASALRGANTFTFELEATRVRADKPDDPQRVFEGRGAVDLRAQSGRMELDLSHLFAGIPAGDDDNPLARPIQLRWDATTLYGESRAGKGSTTRVRARESGGLLGRAPDEPEGLVILLEEGRGARRGDADDTVTFTVPIERAAAAGSPAELNAEAARRLVGPRLEMTATVDGSGRPTRISYVYRLKPTRHAATGRVALPARTVTVAYHLADFGADVEVGARGQNG